MNDDSQHIEPRYSQLYLQKGPPKATSNRMIVRLSHAIPFSPSYLRDLIERELGTPATYMQHATDVREQLAQLELRDVLDLITVIYRNCRSILARSHTSPLRAHEKTQEFLETVRTIFAEENVHYRVDDHGIVHPIVDRIFEAETVSVLAVLQGQRYGNIRHYVDAALAHMDAIPIDGKNAIRSVFQAAEGLFRLIFANAPRLGAAEIRTHLEPRLTGFHGQDQAANRATMKILRGFVDWVDAAHFYRHEEGREEPGQPPDELVILLVSQGLAYIRWLAQIDAASST